MKKLFAIITAFILGAGVAFAQDGGKKAEPSGVSAKKETVKANPCDMKNFCCMRAGKMTRIKDGMEVGMDADLKLDSGAKIATNGTLTDAKGKTVTLNEGDAIDMNGNICTLGKPEYGTPPATPTEVK